MIKPQILGICDPFVTQCLKPVVSQMIDDSKANDSVEKVQQLDNVVAQDAKLVSSVFYGIVVVEKCIHQFFS